MTSVCIEVWKCYVIVRAPGCLTWPPGLLRLARVPIEELAHNDEIQANYGRGQVESCALGQVSSTGEYKVSRRSVSSLQV
jgi:hypothetical protein